MHNSPVKHHKKRRVTAILGGFLWLIAPLGTPSEMEGAQALALGCQGCHGESGEGQGNLPALRTLDRTQFIQRFQAFALDDRAASVMHRIARGYSPEEIRLMADLLAKGAPKP